MIKKITALFLAVVTMMLFFTSCSDGTDAELYYPLYADPVSFDPQIAADNASKIVVFNCFEGLVRVDADGKIIPGVATSWEISPDGKTYLFHLRTDSKWYMSEYAKKLLDEETAKSFNYSVTAEDFVYGLRRAFDPQMGATTDSRLFSIRNAYAIREGELPTEELGVTAVNSSTLKIELTEENDDFLNALTQSAAMPCRKEFFEATKGRYGLDPEKVIYNGPFYLYSWSVGSHLVLYRNESYKGAANVKPSAVFLYINNDLSTRIDKLTDGVYSACPLSVRQKLQINDNDITYIGYNGSVWGLCFNCSDEILSDYSIRSALVRGFNIKDIPMPSFCSDYAKGIVPDICLAGKTSFRTKAGAISFPKADAKTAKELLDTGFENLDISKATLSVVCHESFETVAKLIIQNWQSCLGIHINFTLEALNEIDLEAKVKSKDYDIAFAKITAENESVVGFLGMFSSSGTGNIFNFKSKKYDSLVGITDEILSQDEILANCQTAEQHLTDMAVFLPVFSEESYIGLADGVEGIYAVEAGTVPVFCNGIEK